MIGFPGIDAVASIPSRTFRSETVSLGTFFSKKVPPTRTEGPRRLFGKGGVEGKPFADPKSWAELAEGQKAKALARQKVATKSRRLFGAVDSAQRPGARPKVVAPKLSAHEVGRVHAPSQIRPKMANLGNRRFPK